MKVKEYLVSEILDLKHNIRKLQEDIARKDSMISAQKSRIEYFEKREEQYKETNNSIYGKLCEIRLIISDNLIQELPDYRPVKLSINSEGREKEKEDFTRLLNLLGIPEEKEVPDEVPED